jgi:mono/diheme cytochrome c family protein
MRCHRRRTRSRRNRIAIAGLLVFFVLTAGVLLATELRSRRTFTRPYPDIAASTDPSMIARGEYLVYGSAACAYCHVPREQWTSLDAGEQLPLSGNHVFRLPFGELFSANLTPDNDTGIGRNTDAELARVLRYGVRADGRAAFPLMEFQGLSDEDLTAIVSFLRSRQAVVLDVPDHRLTLLGKALLAFAIEPEGPAGDPPERSPAAIYSVERGEYLANRVSACVSCHTDRDPRSGQLVGPPFAGGQRLDVAADASKVFVPPNLTPDADTSPVGRWSEDEFVARFRQGELVAGTPMPWGAYRRMTDDDVRSLYVYLRTLKPVRHATGPVIQDKN